LETGRKVKFVQRLTYKSTTQNILVFFFVISVSNYPRNNREYLHLMPIHVSYSLNCPILSPFLHILLKFHRLWRLRLPIWACPDFWEY